MREYTFDDFLNTLDDTGRSVALAVSGYIFGNYSEYKPFDIRPMSKTLSEWALNFRKKPKVGKAFCSFYSKDGKLYVQIIPLGFMEHELLLRQNEFSKKIRRSILTTFCRKCRDDCDYQFRQYYYLNGLLHATAIPWCKSNGLSADDAGYYGYGAIGGLAVDDADDLLRLLDMMSKYMTKDSKEIRGNDYLAMSAERCGEIKIIDFEQIELDVDNFAPAEYADPKRLEKYASLYHLTPMGTHGGGFWHYHDDRAVCGKYGNEYAYAVVPGGRYASVTVAAPFSFSAWRSWNYIAKWLYESNINIRPINFGEVCVPFFAKFYRHDGIEYMTVYVPSE